MKIFGIALVSLLVVLATSASVFFGYLYLGGEDIDMAKLDKLEAQVVLLDKDEQPIEYMDNKYLKNGDAIPADLVNAFVAIEDKRFFRHKGLDYYRIAGAMVSNLKGNHLQGGSTITQQLIKNTMLSGQKTLERKFKEAQLAIKLEKSFDKNEIMRMYLNALYFGSGEYGVVNAARRFFDKSLDELSLEECAMLASIVKSPTKYNPIYHYDNAISRTKVVLQKMQELGYVRTNDYKNMDIIIKNKLNENNIYSNYVENAILQASTLLGIPADELAYQDIKICTYLDKAAQQNMYNIVNVSDFYEDENHLGIGILVDNATRGITAFCSKDDVDLFSFRRQPASTIKPLVSYAPAIDMGIAHPLSPILDEKTSFGDYSPNNYRQNFVGWTNIKDSLINSYNIPAVKLLDLVGIENACKYLKDMDFELDKNDLGYPLALGGMTYGTTMLELVGGYCTLANMGEYQPISFVKSIHGNNMLFDNSKTAPKQVFKPTTTYFVNDMMKDCAQNGTARKLSSFDFELCPKTGTKSATDKNFNTDAYNICYTTRHTMLFWQGGKDNNHPMSKSVTGGGRPTLMAKSMLSNIYDDTKPAKFDTPNGLVEKKIDKYDLQVNHKLTLTSDNTPSKFSIKAYFDKENLPNEIDTTFDNLSIQDFQTRNEGDNIVISFFANPRLEYVLYHRNMLSKEDILQTIKDRQGKVEITIKKNHSAKLFFDKYTLIARYLDDDKNYIVGEPSSFYDL